MTKALIAELSDLSNAREARELQALPQLLKDRDLFIDVGAHEGLYLYHASKALSGARLVALEPNPALAPSLSTVVRSLRREGSRNRFEIVRAVVSDEAKPVDFFVDPDDSQSALFPGRGRRKIRVKARPLDSFFRPGARPFIKIDVEGAEYRVLESGRKFLGSDTVFFVELHGWGDPGNGKYPPDVCALFYRNGFAVKPIGSHFLFYKAGGAEKFLSYLLPMPLLFLKSLIYRLFPTLGHGLRRFKDRLAGYKRK